MNNNKKNSNKQSKKSRSQSKKGSVPFGLTVATKPRPARMRTKGSTISVSHTELISTVYNPRLDGTMNLVSLPINPGVVTFPWLRHVAKAYETYTFKKLIFRYVPCCAASKDGLVAMAIDFDALDAAPLSLGSLMSFDGAVSAQCYCQFDMNASALNMKKFTREHFVRIMASPVGSDLKTYDIGNLHVACVSGTGAATWGHVFVDYVVELQTPHVPEEEDPSSFSGKSTSITTLKNQLMKDAVITNSADPIIAAGDVNVLTNLKFLKAGEYLLEEQFSGTTLDDTYPTVSKALGYGDYTETRLHPIVNATGTQATFIRNVSIPTDNFEVSFSAPAAWTTAWAHYLRVSPYDFALA